MQLASESAGGRPSKRPQSGGRAPTSQVAEGVLIVEDDFLVANELEETFHNAGISVIGVASSADEAVAIAREVTPRIAVVDIRLIGKRDGIDAAIQLLADFGVRSIFATAHDDPAIRTRANDAKPLGWMVKPYDPRQLVNLVQLVLADQRKD